jgi:hypothetical protein
MISITLLLQGTAKMRAGPEQPAISGPLAAAHSACGRPLIAGC